MAEFTATDERTRASSGAAVFLPCVSSPPMTIQKPAGRSVSEPRIEAPIPSPAGNALFGSDVVADTLRDLGIEYIALNPGASYRGLHDSIVNHLGNERPQMLLCLHEEHAVALAHGYAKVTGRPMAAAVHSNVGLFHATMAIFNAWCDRTPVVVIGATGPVDAMKRRPFIDWIHTARDQGALVRNYTKWDDQPASPGAAREALMRAAWIASSVPMGPVYINLDAEMQEKPLGNPLPRVDVSRYRQVARSTAAADLLDVAAALLDDAKHPLILIGRTSRSEKNWAARVDLAERLGASVMTSLLNAAAFPSDHALHDTPTTVFLSAEGVERIRAADVILSLDWVDLAGTLRSAHGDEPSTARIVHASLDHQLHNGWSMDHQAMPPVDVMLAGDPDDVVAQLLTRIVPGPNHLPSAKAFAQHPPDTGTITTIGLAHALRAATAGETVSLVHVPVSWDASTWPLRHPLDFIGGDGGGGIGSGPGVSIGAALALKNSGRLAISVLGDGDFLMGVTALWTAAHYRIPVLFVVANNQSFFNDEIHQERVAKIRGRPVANRWIGQRIADPDVDLTQMAQGQGAVAFGPVSDPKELSDLLAKAITALKAGRVVVVDVRIEPGYVPALESAMRRIENTA